MRARLGLPAEERPDKSRVIIAEIQGKKYGLHVDEVREIVEVAEENVETENLDVLNMKAEFTVAIISQENDLFIVLDMQRLLSSADPVRE